MKSSSFGGGQSAAGLSRMTLMRPFTNLVENLKRLGVQYILFHSNDGQDHQIHLSAWREEHVFQGIHINGKMLCPNVTSAFLNPFLPQPILVVTCDIIELPEHDNKPSKVTVVAESVITDQQSESKSGPFQAKVHADSCHTDKPAAEKKKGGTSCHQCKNVKAVEGLVFCQKKFDRRHRSDKRSCRKKYCPHCLMKFYAIGPEQFSAPDWFCPSCSNICRCAACARQSLLKTDVNHDVLHERESALHCTHSTDSCLPQPTPTLPDAPNLTDALELQGQFSNFTHASPTSSDENNEMLNVPSAGMVVQISSTAGDNLSNSVMDNFRSSKRLRVNESHSLNHQHIH